MELVRLTFKKFSIVLGPRIILKIRNPQGQTVIFYPRFPISYVMDVH